MQVPQIITTSPPRTSIDEENTGVTSAVSTYPQFTTSPSRSRGSSFAEPSKTPTNELTLVDNSEQASGSNSTLDPSILVRTVYSPSVSREPSLQRRHSASSQTSPPTTKRGPHGDVLDVDGMTRPLRSISTEELAIDTSTSSSAAQPGMPYSQGEYIWSPVTAASSYVGNPTWLDRMKNCFQSDGRRRIMPEDERRDRRAPVFKAFPERKWLNSEVIAQTALGVIVVCVLANLIYS